MYSVCLVIGSFNIDIGVLSVELGTSIKLLKEI